MAPGIKDMLSGGSCNAFDTRYCCRISNSDCLRWLPAMPPLWWRGYHLWARGPRQQLEWHQAPPPQLSVLCTLATTRTATWTATAMNHEDWTRRVVQMPPVRLSVPLYYTNFQDIKDFRKCIRNLEELGLLVTNFKGIKVFGKIRIFDEGSTFQGIKVSSEIRIFDEIRIFRGIRVLSEIRILLGGRSRNFQGI